ncbi:MAG: MoxR family ATPase [Actinomycetota bacterium]|nr:MoxR family ATPase [Actinomycetota bacterium]MDK1017170.1 MoxR family ATPase [Actinomycetota bacterium]MDK1027039.1 MoxR family ATPase [Actinomycetota bacterium]MDK1039432.1 MoxR family ATPase [Actinomycetota bacterium]MDK1097311.1 MoxR family ATPase [Actinomycetota bacterium]
MAFPSSVDALEAAFIDHGYIPERGLSVAIHLAIQMGRPLFVEGEPGVGKTEIANVLTAMSGGELIRLQCYEGLDASHALYEWDYARQMLAIRLLEAQGGEVEVHDIMSEKYLIARPLLQAIRRSSEGLPTVLLIDELDRADAEFEAYLLELLSDFQITIPEVGTIRASTPPIVIITSNRTREIHDAVKRRCIYHWIDYPTVEREIAILHKKAPEISEVLSRELAEAMQKLRNLDLFKPPGVAETVDWAMALRVLGETELSLEVIDETIGVIVKYEEDIQTVRAAGSAILV